MASFTQTSSSYLGILNSGITHQNIKKKASCFSRSSPAPHPHPSYPTTILEAILIITSSFPSYHSTLNAFLGFCNHQTLKDTSTVRADMIGGLSIVIFPVFVWFINQFKGPSVFSTAAFSEKAGPLYRPGYELWLL